MGWAKRASASNPNGWTPDRCEMCNGPCHCHIDAIHISLSSKDYKGINDVLAISNIRGVQHGFGHEDESIVQMREIWTKKLIDGDPLAIRACKEIISRGRNISDFFNVTWIQRSILNLRLEPKSNKSFLKWIALAVAFGFAFMAAMLAIIISVVVQSAHSWWFWVIIAMLALVGSVFSVASGYFTNKAASID